MAATLSLVAGCGGAGSAPAPTAAPTPADLRITQADEGKTIPARVGDAVRISLGDQFEWAFEVSDTRVLAVQSITSADFSGRAVTAGTVTVSGTGKPKCTPQQPCIQIIAVFKVTIAVR